MMGSLDMYNELRNMTKLPIIPKGILTVEDAKIAVSLGAPAIILSNHGARHLDGVPSPLQVALAIHDEAPELFTQTEVLADCGVRYGTDALKLLALGVKAVGLGRSFMYANIYGQAGVEKAIEILKTELVLDAINLGVTDFKQLNSSWVSLE
jgi:isopentenyl diphosphate isomerase/L-lactate dehydrogenase-like FMN-dependent dehydrogenase